MIKEAEELRDSNKKKVNRLQTEINELKESMSDNFIDVTVTIKQTVIVKMLIIIIVRTL